MKYKILNFWVVAVILVGLIVFCFLPFVQQNTVRGSEARLNLKCAFGMLHGAKAPFHYSYAKGVLHLKNGKF